MQKLFNSCDKSVIDKWLYHSQIIVDSNMKLVHLQNRRPDDDVSLSDGELFNVKRTPYAQHLATAPDKQLVCYQYKILYLTIPKRYPEITVQ